MNVGERAKANEGVWGADVVGASSDRFMWIRRVEGDEEAALFLERMHASYLEAMTALQARKVRVARWWVVQAHTIQGTTHVFVCVRMGGEAEGQIEVPGRSKPNGILR